MNPSYFLPSQFPNGSGSGSGAGNGAGPSNYSISSGNGNSNSSSGSGSGSSSPDNHMSGYTNPSMNQQQQYYQNQQQQQQQQQMNVESSKPKNPPTKTYQTQAEQRQALHPPSQGPLILPHQDLNSFLESFWKRQMDNVEGEIPDWKSYNLPLARIKKVMKSDEEVRMISAEAPIMFSKACEIFISELTCRAWLVAESHKRRTLQKSDVAAAIAFSDMFDFLIDIVPRDDGSGTADNANGNGSKEDGGGAVSGNGSVVEGEGEWDGDIDVDGDSGHVQDGNQPQQQQQHNQSHNGITINNNSHSTSNEMHISIQHEQEQDGDDLYNEYVQED